MTKYDKRKPGGIPAKEAVIAQWCQEHNLSVEAVTQSLDMKLTIEEFAQAILCCAAQIEREQIVKRATAGKRRVANKKYETAYGANRSFDNLINIC